MNHDFAFVLDADAHDADVEDKLFDPCFSDTTLILQHGALVLSFDRDGPSFKEAVLSAYKDIRSTGIRILSFDPDYLVTSAEIARRVQKSRSVISKYEKLASENDFPSPVRDVMSSRPFYDWVQVSKWFCLRGELDVEEYHHALVSRTVNFGTQAEAMMEQPVDMAKLLNRALETA